MFLGIGLCDLKLNEYNRIYYNKWAEMLRRCYSEKYRNKYPTYKDCTVCKEWLTFSNFLQWCINYEKVYKITCKDYALDKDLKGSRRYSPETCCFLPKNINTFLTIYRRNNTSGYIGVSYQKYTNLFKAEINDFFNGNRVSLGYYKTAEEAARRYSLEKIKIAYNIEMQGLLDYDHTLNGLLISKIEEMLLPQI